MNVSHILQILVVLMIIGTTQIHAAHKPDAVIQLSESLDGFATSLGELSTRLEDITNPYKDKKYQHGNWQVIGFYADVHKANVGMEDKKSWQGVITILSNDEKFESPYFESSHSFIQWLFPLFTKSGPNPDAPVLTGEIVDEFKKDQKLIEKLINSFKIVVGGYYNLDIKVIQKGITREKDNIKISIKKDGYAKTKANMITSSHNLLRVSRILGCMQALGLKNYSEALATCLGTFQSKKKELDKGFLYSYSNFFINYLPPQKS